MSDQTKVALDAAIAAHVAETGEGSIVTDWALIAATTSMENIGTGTTRYLLEGNDNQPVHVMTGLFRYASERVMWDDDEEDEDV
ncbi:hypothetical protein [Microbacterium sp. A94]|uniref:hypothetical protein n=1 Tax=Microbacterium sp. A94 TaxID=3450717 RepID=UPI003F42331B